MASFLAPFVRRSAAAVAVRSQAARAFSSGADELKSVLAAKIPSRIADTKAFLGEYGNTKLGDVTVAQALSLIHI